MKKAWLVLLGAVIGFAVSQGPQLIMRAVEAGKERRFGADIRSAMDRLEDYRREHTTYPVACDAKSLSAQLGAGSIVGASGDTEFQEGDIVVIYGTPDALEHAEAVLLAG